MATIEQGMKVFTAVYKRLYRALTSEFRKLYKLNKIYLNPQEEIDILDEPIQQSDYFGPEKDIVPAADPNAVSSQEKQAKVQAVMQILQLGTVDPMWATKLYMEAHEINGWEQGVHPPQPQQDPKQQELQMKAQLEQQKAQRDMMMASEKLKLEQMSKEQEMAHKAKMQQMELQAKQMEAILSAKESQAKLQAQQQQHQQNLVQQHQQNQMNMATTQANHQMQMQHQQEANKQKLTVSKEKPTNAKSVKK